ncbi:MAG: dephospho-CoA kinase, partial [Planctomycetota bacterium]
MAQGRKRQLVVGLVGQVCAGKSTVAHAFRRQGATVWDADQAVHELYTRPDVAAQVRALFGPDVLDEQGGVDRVALGRLVFSDPAQLKRLTAEVIFPRAHAVLDAELARFRASGGEVLLLDAPTLIEAGQAGLCDQVVFVSACFSRRQKWSQARGWKAGELEKREACMLDEERKRRVATASIHNDGTLDDVEAQAAKL